MPVPRLDARRHLVRLVPPAALAAVLVGGTGVARAAVVVGPDPLPPATASQGGAGPCPGVALDACTVALLRDGSGTGATMPADGVLTAVRVRGAPGARDDVRLRLLRPSGDGTFAPVADAGSPTLDGSGTAQELPLALPVRRGDVLAVRGPALPPVFGAATGAGAHAVFTEPPTWPVGGDARAPDDGAAPPGELLVAADLEPDDDGDGAGDETQDACPVDPARVTACVADLRLTVSAPDFEVAGRPVDHVYTVANGGPGPVQDVLVDLEVLDAAELVSIAAPGACVAAAGVRLRCPVGTLAPGASARIVFTLVGPQGAVARTQARGVAPADDPVPGDLTAGAGTLLTDASVAPGPRPFAAFPCANQQVGTGDDEVLSGTSFGDRLQGRAGRDLLRGFAGDDCLEGGDGRDVLDGGEGADRLAGGGGHDRLLGGFGPDTLRGGLGEDALVGGPGGDQLFPGPARDRVDAGEGDDTVDARDGIRENVDCGRGSDRARVDRRDRVRGCERVARG